MIRLPLRNAKGELHPMPDRHPYGEDRCWCVCGKPAWIDDVAFAKWHVDGSSARACVKNEGKSR